jgi:hypothetical protein
MKANNAARLKGSDSAVPRTWAPKSASPQSADIRRDGPRVSKVPLPDLSRRSKQALLDHLVGDCEHPGWNIQVERLGGSEIEHHVELRGLFHGNRRALCL